MPFAFPRRSAGRGGAASVWEPERPLRRLTPAAAAAVGRGRRWCVRCALFFCRGDERAGFFHLTPLGEENNHTREGRVAMQTTTHIKAGALTSNHNQTLVQAQGPTPGLTVKTHV